MENHQLIVLCIGIYLFILLTLGLIARRRSKSNSLKDFYLAGGKLGSFVLLLTLYATQYSANTLLVTPAEIVNRGMGMILVLGYMTAIVIFYLSFAPQLYRISHTQDFITPGDYFDYRYNYPRLTLLANIILVIVSVNFLLSQLIAMGHITNGITGGEIPYWTGVVFLALVVIIYESLGGMRAVAWTDVIQGIMLFIGIFGLLITVLPGKAELIQIGRWLNENAPEKISVPKPSFQIYWISSVLMIGLAGSVYPQVIQRIYAAKSTKVLRQSLGAMVFMPLLTVLVLFFLGFISIPHFQTNPQIANDEVLPEMLRIWGEQSQFTFFMTILVLIGLLAAIMSTADSVLLSLSSIIAKDILGKSLLKDRPDSYLTRTGKIISWIIMFSMVLIALQPKITLWGLIELKMQILVQIAPLFLLGVYSKSVTARGMFYGLCTGFAFAAITFTIGINTIGGVHAGLWGLILNIGSCFLFSKKNE